MQKHLKHQQHPDFWGVGLRAGLKDDALITLASGATNAGNLWPKDWWNWMMMMMMMSNGGRIVSY